MGKKLSKLLGVFCVGLLFALCGMSASAAETQENVLYYDENGVERYVQSATVVTDSTIEWTEGWYVVEEGASVAINGNITVQGEVNLILSLGSNLEINGSILGDEQTASLNIYAQYPYVDNTEWRGWESGAIGHLEIIKKGNSPDYQQWRAIRVNTSLYGGCVDAHINAPNIYMAAGFLNASRDSQSIDFDSFTMSGGYVRGIYGLHDRRTDVTITDGKVEGGINVDGNVSITGGTITESVNGNWVDISNAVVGRHAYGELQVNVYSGSVKERVSSNDGVINIIGGTVGDVFSLNQIYIGDADSGTTPIIEGGIVSNELGVPGTVWMETGIVYGDINTQSLTMYGGEIMGNITISRTDIIAGENDDLYGKNGMIYGGVCNGITASMGTTLNVFGGNIQYVGLEAGCELNINGGTISSVYGDGNNCVVYDYTAGQALPADFNPYDMLYLSYDLTNKTVTGLLGGNVRLAQDFGVYAPSEWGDQAKMEVIILPGATATVNCFRFTGDLLVQGTLQASPDISTNPMVIGTTPYYAINADAETVASVSAGDSIVRDGITFVPEGKVVTLKSKGTGAMHWAAQPAYLNVTNNKFYMPDEVVSVKASALPLEATPTIQVDGEKLTGFTAGEYYSISDAIFRPTGTTLPIRPEWYGATVSIVKLGDGFATGDSFAQALAIPSQSGGTVTPPNPGGGTGSKPDPDDPEEIVIPDGDWEEAEEELSQADSGDTVIVETDEDDTLPGEVLESAAGKNVTLIIQVGTTVSWEIDCREIPKATSFTGISLKVSMNTRGIPESVLQGLPGSHPFQQMTLGHDGPFGFPVNLHTNVGRENSGKWANLYYYNEETGKMEFETAARVSASGDVAFTMTHASQYAIVLDEKSHTLSFQDVKEGSWFQGAVEYVYRAGLMAGTGDTTFEPNAKLTRAMTAQILYNLEGQPEVTGEATFSDMNTAPDWSMDAIAWAQDTGVVAGMGDNTFDPNLKVTREQFAQMLYNYAKYKKCDLTKAGDLTKFPDEGSVSDWAVTALSWANGNGLINGHENGTLDPQGNTVRGQAASILMNFDLNVVKSVA